MYMTISKLVYPKPEDIQIIKEDVVDKNDPEEHNFNLKVLDRIVLTLTEAELVTIISKGNFALQAEGNNVT